MVMDPWWQLAGPQNTKHRDREAEGKGCMLSSLTLTVGVHAEKHRDWAGRDSERNTRTGAKLPILPLKVCRRASMTRDADVRHGLPEDQW